ncbi:MAG: hypothetical protein QXV17_05875 [Candidatus Micrarchaeaceae archaeon]
MALSRNIVTTLQPSFVPAPCCTNGCWAAKMGGMVDRTELNKMLIKK